MMPKSHFMLGALVAFTTQATATCFAPEPTYEICYNVTNGATPQNLMLADLSYTAGYLRYYGGKKGDPQFYTMELPAADNCAEWQVTVKGSTLIVAKLIGNSAASVLFDDIAATIDGGPKATPAQVAAALLGCGSDGGQIGVAVNTTDPRYQLPQFTNGTYVNTGIIIKAVANIG